MYCLSLSSRTRPRVCTAADQGRPTLACRLLLSLPHVQKSGQVEMGEGQGPPEQEGERAQDALRNKERGQLGRKLGCGSGKSGQSMLLKLVGLEMESLKFC